jgi:hypothetical protein
LIAFDANREKTNFDRNIDNLFDIPVPKRKRPDEKGSDVSKKSGGDLKKSS